MNKENCATQDTLLMSYSFLVFPVPDLFVNPSSDRLRGLPNDDQRLEDGCAYNLRHRLLDCRPFCQCFPFRSRRQFTTTIWVSSALTKLFLITTYVFIHFLCTFYTDIYLELSSNLAWLTFVKLRHATIMLS